MFQIICAPFLIILAATFWGVHLGGENRHKSWASRDGREKITLEYLAEISGRINSRVYGDDGRD
jgi:hypothetical protein